MKIMTVKPEQNGNHQIVLTVTNEPVMVDFASQIDDILVSSPDGDLLISWDKLEWNDNECLLVKEHDNLKEINNLRCTKFLMKAKLPSDTLTVYLTSQRN